jgi:hypothetical protein
MAKLADTSVYDAALNVIKGATSMTICSSQPANQAGIAALTLATVTMASGDYTIAAGTTTPIGRKITMAAKNSLSITGTGTQTANWVVLSTASLLVYVTSCAAQSLTNGGTVNVSTWTIEILGPS